MMKLRINEWILLFCLLSTACLAGEITVNENCELSDAIMAANSDQAVNACEAGNGSDTITVEVPGTTLNVNDGQYPSVVQSGMMTAFPAITSELTIEGNGLRVVADTSINQFRVFEFFNGMNLRFTMKDVQVVGADNGDGTGSALFSFGGNLTLQSCDFIENHGAVMVLESQNVIIKDVVFSENWSLQSDLFSPALELVGVSAMVDGNSLINNQVIITETEVNLSNSHPGGALSITSPNSGLIQVINNTISGNQSVTGGGVSIRDQNGFNTNHGTPSPVEFMHNTVTNNFAVHVGGVVIHDVISSARFRYNLIVGNQALQEEGEEIWLSDPNDLLMDGHNVISNHQLNNTFSQVLGSSDLITSEPLDTIIEPLMAKDHAWFHPLMLSGVAIDVDVAGCQLAVDQLNQLRPIDGNADGEAGCDAGSIENQDLIFKSDFD